ncbi:putative membrane protein YdjX (TVP38/TMEM64 family) [Salirhabdus euzebyi]|uniref:TVP38/TMEM64 family membrane protein n=1 Tax=Salirhabdus euzebyi TaxID=394506 RepID=A0A841Q943_9BACI|nr:TVP38/TMEM64 family protein [Salirhabdus euzebyi]MBB6454920.1 putative membrane protein YdjX (TVP38/TMEM64 family) [Salirhabdus euzebyi]
MKKWIFLGVFYIITIVVGFQNKALILAWIQESTLSQLPIMFFTSVLLSVFPIVPFTLFAGVMGVKYGAVLGMAINWFGGVSAAALFFLLARYGFQENFRKKIEHYKGLEKFTRMIEQNAFVAVLLVRLISLVPPPVVNIYSGLSRMPFKVYILATGIGKIPSMFFYAFSGSQLFESIGMFIFGLSVYVLFVIFIILMYKKWFKDKEKIITE